MLKNNNNKFKRKIKVQEIEKKSLKTRKKIIKI